MRHAFFLSLALLGLSSAPASAAVTVEDARVTEGGDVVFTVTRTNDLESASARTADGSAKAGSDFTALPSTPVEFDGFGDRTSTVTVKTTADTAAELDETFTLELVNGLGQVGDTATGTIVDDDASPLSVLDAAVDERAGAVDVVVTSTPISRDVSFDVSAVNGSGPSPAIDTLDFDGRAQRVTIKAGADRATVRIPIGEDATDEDDETFSVVTGGATNGTPARTGTVTIRNDDLKQLAIGDVTVAEADGPNAVARVPVTLTGPTFRPVTVRFGTIDGPARAPRDFLARLGELTIPPGQTTGVIELAIVSDEVVERPEAFGVLLGSATGASIAKASAAVTITDDDALAGPTGDDVPPNVRVDKPAVRGSRVTVRVSCPRNETLCNGRLTLFSEADRRAKAKLLRKERRLARTSFRLRGGQARTLRMTLPRTTLAAARSTGRLRLRAYVLTTDANDNADTSTSSVTARFRRAARR